MSAPTVDATAPARAARRWPYLTRTDAAELGVLVVFWSWVAWPFLRPDRYVVGFDTLSYSAPNLAFTLQEWRDGRLPLWNDTIFGGVAHLGNPQAGALYPLKALVLGMDVNRGLAWLVALHLAWLALGMWVVARRVLLLRAPSGLVAGAVGIGTAAMMVKAIQFEQILVAAWAPWVLVVLGGLLVGERPWRWTLPAALVVTMLALAGHPQIAYLLVALAAAFLAGRLLDLRAWRRLGVVAAVGVFGALMAAPQLAAAVDATRASALTGGRSEENLRIPAFTLDPAVLPQGVLGDPVSSNAVAVTGAFESAGGYGVAAVCLALVAVLSERGARRWTVRLLAVCAAGSVVLAVGPRWPTYRVLMAVVPGFDQGRVPARWMLVGSLAVAVLAAVGAHHLRERAIHGRRATVFVAVGAATSLVLWWGPFQEAALPTRVVWLLLGVSFVAAVGLAENRGRWAAVAVTLPAALLVGELALANHASAARLLLQPLSLTGYVSPATEFLEGRPERVVAMTFDRLDQPRYLVATLRPNANTLFGIRSIDGYDGGVQVTRRWATAMDGLVEAPFNAEGTLRSQLRVPLDAHRAARLGVRWAMVDTEVLPAAVQVPGWLGPRAAEGTVEVWENPVWVGSAVLWPATLPVADGEEAARLLEGSLGSLRATALVEDGPALTCTAACAPAPATVTRHRAGAVDVAVSVPDGGDRVLVVDEQADRNWRVTVDGRDTATVVVDGLYAGVVVPPGDHRVAFRYAPGWLVPSVVIGLVALVGAAAVSGTASARQRRPWASARGRRPRVVEGDGVEPADGDEAVAAQP